MSAIKETDYFQHNFTKGIAWFEQQFSHYSGEPVVGEASPGNMVEPDAPARLADINSGMKCIFMLRDPVDRLLSQHYYGIHSGRDRYKASLSKWIRDETNPWRNRNIELGLYYKHITRFARVFGMENIILIDFDRFVKSPDRELKKVYSLLDVDSEFTPHLNIQTNKSSVPLNESAYRWIRYGFRRIRSLAGHDSTICRVLEPARRAVRSSLLRLHSDPVANLSEKDLYYLAKIFSRDSTCLRQEFGFSNDHWRIAAFPSSNFSMV